MTAVLSPTFLIAAGIAVITASILAIEAGITYSLYALQNSNYNLDNLLMLKGDDTPAAKYEVITGGSVHAIKAQKDLTLRALTDFLCTRRETRKPARIIN